MDYAQYVIQYVPTYLLWYLIGINTVTFIMFGYDKWMATSNAWRTPEMVLWIFSLLGGSVGAIAGMKIFHHKTRKVSFQFVFILILVVQALVVAGWLYYNGYYV